MSDEKKHCNKCGYDLVFKTLYGGSLAAQLLSKQWLHTCKGCGTYISAFKCIRGGGTCGDMFCFIGSASEKDKKQYIKDNENPANWKSKCSQCGGVMDYFNLKYGCRDCGHILEV